jgi:Nucleoside-diphosphate-sugar epimerases
MINNNSKIFITGHKGLVGSAVYNLLKKKKFKKLIIADKKKLNLLNTKKVFNFVNRNNVEVIINCAAKVGGILANSNNPIDFLYENIQMQHNLLFAARK